MSLKGSLLVAKPALLDPNFARTVVLLLEHTDEGALGVVLNRPSSTPLDDALPGWTDVASPPAVVFVGGPVGLTGALGLGRAPDPAAAGLAPVSDALGLIDLERGPEAAAGLDGVRVFLGHAGWGPGQLESELEERAWWVLAAEPDDAFDPGPEELWRAVLRRQPGRLRLFASYPPHPSLN